MSYEPQILISASSLKSKADEIIKYGCDYPQDEVNGFIENLFSHPSSFIKGEGFLLCHPELTSFNKKVREKLDEYEIEYCVFN